jgi:hypothetical protein
MAWSVSSTASARERSADVDDDDDDRELERAVAARDDADAGAASVLPQPSSHTVNSPMQQQVVMALTKWRRARTKAVLSNTGGWMPVTAHGVLRRASHHPIGYTRMRSAKMRMYSGEYSVIMLEMHRPPSNRKGGVYVTPTGYVTQVHGPVLENSTHEASVALFSKQVQ